MVYTPKTDWQDAPSTATPITKTELLRIEYGIAGASQDAADAKAASDANATATANNSAAVAALQSSNAAKAAMDNPIFLTGITTPAIKITGGNPGPGKVLTSDSLGNATWQAGGSGGGGVISTAYPQVVIVTNGTEARPLGSTSVIWIDMRDAPTSPDNRDMTNDLWFTKSGVSVGGDTTPPSVPTGLASSGITTTGFTVTWSAATDDTAVTGYQVRTDSNTPISLSGTSYTFSGLTSGTTYAVTVRARDAAGNWSAWSSALSVSTSSGGGPDTTAPTIPTGLASSAITSTGFTVSWTASTDAVGVTGYEVFLDGVSYATPAGTSQVVTGRAPNTGYLVTVRARDAAGNWSAQSSALSVTTSTSGGVISRFNFNEGSGGTATSVSGGYTMVDMTGGSPAWGSGTIKSWVRGYIIGPTGAAIPEWSVALDLTLNALPGTENTFWLKDGSNQTYFNFMPSGAIKVYGSNIVTNGGAVVSTGTPHRIVVTQDATTLTVYLDGTSIITSTEHRDLEHSLHSLNVSGGLNMDVDTLRVWDSALSAGAVAGLGA